MFTTYGEARVDDATLPAPSSDPNSLDFCPDTSEPVAKIGIPQDYQAPNGGSA